MKWTGRFSLPPSRGGTFTNLCRPVKSFPFPFQGPHGQTHTHKPRRGERGWRTHRVRVSESQTHTDKVDRELPKLRQIRVV